MTSFNVEMPEASQEISGIFISGNCKKAMGLHKGSFRVILCRALTIHLFERQHILLTSPIETCLPTGGCNVISPSQETDCY